MDVNFEFTAKATPQQNSKVETGFAALSAHAKAMMNGANVPLRERYKLFQEVATTATKLDWLTTINLNGEEKTRMEHYGFGIPKFSKYLRTRGEAGTIKTGKDGKGGDRGATCMFIGYANNHEGDCYRMWNPETTRTSETRDVIFLNRMFFTNKCLESDKTNPQVSLDVKKQSIVTKIPNPEDVTAKVREGTEKSVRFKPETEEVTSAPDPKPGPAWLRTTTRSGRQVGRKDGQYDPSTGLTVAVPVVEQSLVNYHRALAEIDEEEVQTTMEFSNAAVEYHNVGAGVGGGFDHTLELKPKKYKESINGPD